ncbi:T4 RnlA family RNA ligase [Streptomyces nanshensis]|uniref:T4 RnlA family RNA ligase n=1 Tax=Streptomyces nanshensis TaxID=518642 RepID=UPI000AA6C62E|nr:T4 RnlA family RNA ligase [Streptomyces nanshensis]
MTTLDSLFPAADLDDAVRAGHVARKDHPHLPLVMFNYTRACQYAGAWTPVTTRCRGLVVEKDTGRVIAWPFEKFFNVAEHDLGRPYAPPLPAEPFHIYDKLDGSLGLVFHYDGRWHAATKGSFDSPQAQWAQRWLDAQDTAGLRPGVTYLTEIIYPGNRIVVNYGDRAELVLLAAFTGDGDELDLREASEHWSSVGPVVRTWPSTDLGTLLKRTETNQHADGSPASALATEGYVLRFASGVRAKAKLAEYVQLHKSITGSSEVDIWRYLGVQKFRTQPVKQLAKALACPVGEVEKLTAAPQGPLEALLEQVPDEFDAWVRTVTSTLEEGADRTRRAIETAYAEMAHLAGDRRAFAEAAQRYQDPAVRSGLYLRLDGRDLSLHIWRSLKPAASPAPGVVEEG